MGCTLPRAPAVRTLSEGREGQLQGSPSGCLDAQIQRRKESTRLPGPLAGVYGPDTRRLSPWAPRKCMRAVGSLALSSPAETCAGVWGLILRVWVPAHSSNSGEAAPEEARFPAGCALAYQAGAQGSSSRYCSGAASPELGLWAGTQTRRIRPQTPAHGSAGEESAREPTSVIHFLGTQGSASVCAGLKTPARGPGSLVLSLRR